MHDIRKLCQQCHFHEIQRHLTHKHNINRSMLHRTTVHTQYCRYFCYFVTRTSYIGVVQKYDSITEIADASACQNVFAQIE